MNGKKEVEYSLLLRENPTHSIETVIQAKFNSSCILEWHECFAQFETGSIVCRNLRMWFVHRFLAHGKKPKVEFLAVLNYSKARLIQIQHCWLK